MTKKIQLIAEGDGDVRALPELVRRILEDHLIYDVHIAHPTHKRGELPVVKKRFEEFFEFAVIENYPVLCVLDFDCATCSDVDTEELQFFNRAQKLRPNYPFRACFIVKEYESLFLWDLQALKAVFTQLLPDYSPPELPENIRNAKGALSDAQSKGWAYKPTVHQALLSKKVDLTILRRQSPSFQRLEKAVLDLVASMSPAARDSNQPMHESRDEYYAQFPTMLPDSTPDIRAERDLR